MPTRGSDGPYFRPLFADPQNAALSPLQVLGMWETVKAHALRVEMARQRILSVPITPVYDSMPGGPRAVPVPIWEGINALHRAHRAVWASQLQLQYSEAQLLSQMLSHYCPVRH